MKEYIQKRLGVLLVLLLAVGGISVFLNNVSFNPDFSVMDVMSGATKKAKQRKNENKEVLNWGYTREEIVLPENEDYEEEMVIAGTDTYRILRKVSGGNVSMENSSQKEGSLESSREIVLLSNRENSAYQTAVQQVASCLKKQGYKVRIKNCTEIMMLSLVHAGHFDVFLMREEVQE